MGRGAEVDLHIKVDRRNVRRSIESCIRAAIVDGRLVRGARLPSARALAQELDLARNTVASAYAHLTAEGWLVAARGAGSRVAHQPDLHRAHGGDRELRPVHDLRVGFPNLAVFPRREWLAAARAALLDAPLGAFDYPDAQGVPELRDEVAAYVGRVRGVRATADRVVICSGTVNAFALISAVLHARGAERMAVESYCWRNLVCVARAVGMHPVPITVDENGLRVDELATERAAAVLVTPSHQFPTGVTLQAQRRQDLLDWAKETDGLVVEDDYDGEFRYDASSPPPIQPDAPDRVAYLGTISKSLSPALRLSWLVLPDGLVADVVRHKLLLGAQASAVEQRTLARFIRSGAYDHHVRRSRVAYRKRRDHLTAELAARSPRAALQPVSAGLHAVIRLPDGMNEETACARAAARGMVLETLSMYQHAPVASQPPSVVVGFGTPPDHGFRPAVAALTDLLSEY